MSQDNGPWIDEEEAACRLLCLVDRPLGDDRLAALLKLPQLAGLLLTGDALPAAGDLVRACHAAARACIVAGEAKVAASSRADGVLLDDSLSVEEARRALGRDALIGVACGYSRHEAMVAGERGADYVLFGTIARDAGTDVDGLAGLCTWWSDLFVLPAIAAGALDAEAAATLADAGSGFVLPDLDPATDEGLAAIEAIAARLPDRPA